MPRIIKPAVGSFTTADITVDSSGRIIDASTGSAGGTFITATGGTITTVGDYKVHTFKTSGTFTVTAVGSGAPESDKVEYVVVGGGGGAAGGQTAPGGGGGGGGYRSSGISFPDPRASNERITVTAQAYPITVGAGGSAGGPGSSGGTGGTSSFATITSGGGGGGAVNGQAPNAAGSGGGPGKNGPHPGGASPTAPTTPEQGHPAQPNGPSHTTGGTAGGGAMSNRSNVGTAAGGIGCYVLGNSIAQNLTDPNYSGTAWGLVLAGGGGSNRPSASAGDASNELGFESSSPNSNNIDNTGCGGFGLTGTSSGAGGSGVVYIRYRFQS